MKLEKMFKYPDQWELKNGYFIKKDHYVCPTVFCDDMQQAHFDEAGSFWYKVREDICLALMKKYFVTDRQTDRQTDAPLISDIGGGNGVLAKELSASGFNMLLMEPSEIACRNAQKLGIKNIVCASINDEDFNDNSFGDCLLLDVIEHIKDDDYFLKILNKKMQAGKFIIISAPAFECLTSSHDKLLGHFRRYNTKTLCEKLSNNGFKCIKAGYFFSYLFFAVLLVFGLGEKIGFLKNETLAEDGAHRGHTSNKVISLLAKFVGKIEMFCLLKGIKIPVGSSLVVLAKKI
ncbi:MAG: class I SAM-dependent methyltransferase [Elusimicrobiota bacterium]|jgi:2-polyprenyl-3-methyl-5-hydroxy-6-metoxy-1,4-benzoquinol methylase|nr:class I SAM-dependent methyltransferase [Elusimicrobiota bacterium]